MKYYLGGFSMRKFILIFLLGILFVFPSLTSAQTNVTLNSVNVQLWPEYDQPSMLVIVDFKIAPMTPLPADLTFRIPIDSNLIAVAFQTEDGNLVNANFTTPVVNDAWQTFNITIDQNTIYRFEYYQPLQFKGDERSFVYIWEQAYTVNNFSVAVLEPLDVSAMSIQPDAISIEQVNGLNLYQGAVSKISAKQTYNLDLLYTKNSLTLITEPQQVQPADPLNENTPGRVSLNNFLPYLLGGFGILFITVGIVYYWRFGRSSSKRNRRRKTIVEDDDPKTGMYCPQCGTRAKSGDRFCRTCGAKLRKSVE
jgi:hypothetical protein